MLRKGVVLDYIFLHLGIISSRFIFVSRLLGISHPVVTNKKVIQLRQPLTYSDAGCRAFVEPGVIVLILVANGTHSNWSP